MKLLLDESLPRRLRDDFGGHEVSTVPDEGWAGLQSGALLLKVAERFDVFLTADQNLRHQQNLPGFEIAVVVLAARTNRLEDLRALVGRTLELLPTLSPGSVEVVVA